MVKGDLPHGICLETGKFRHRKRRGAKKQIKALERRQGSSETQLFWYRCPHCRDYHVAQRRNVRRAR